jgi:hypothetical protein
MSDNLDNFKSRHENIRLCINRHLNVHMMVHLQHNTVLYLLLFSVLGSYPTNLS